MVDGGPGSWTVTLSPDAHLVWGPGRCIRGVLGREDFPAQPSRPAEDLHPRTDDWSGDLPPLKGLLLSHDYLLDSGHGVMVS